MSRAMMIHCSLLALMVCCLSAGPAETAPSSPESQVRKLKDQLDNELAQNARLRQRNEELEKQLLVLSQQLNKLEAQLKSPTTMGPIPQLNLPQLKLPRFLPDGKAVPPDWDERQFNGVPYYIIPLEGNAVHPQQNGMR